MRAVLVGVIAVVLAAAAWALWYAFTPREESAYIPTPEAPRKFIPEAESTGVQVTFVDITESAGIRFRHSNGARGKKLLPETMGGGCAFIDFDGDQDQDLLFINSAPWPGDPADKTSPPPAQALYENDGGGHFTDVTAERGLALTFYGMGAAVGDYDSDGWDDIFITGIGGNRLFRNLAGKKFEDVTALAGISSDGPHAWYTSAAFLDYDNDSRLDLFVCRYVDWSPEADLAQAFQITGIGRAYGPPQNFAGTFSQLYRNTGSGFRDVSEKAGIQVRNPLTGDPMGKSLGVAVHDFNEDGYADIAVANDTVQNFFFQNKGDGTFEEIGILSGFAFDAAGNTRGAMGIDCADVGTSGAKAIVVGNFANEITALYKSEQPGLLPFSDDAIAEGIGNPSRKYMKFGVFFFDFDLDGRLDIFEANGHLETEIETVQARQTYKQPAQLFWNAGPKARRGFEVLEADQVGPDLFRPVVGRGCACADIDGDGDLDVVLIPNNGEARLFRNDGGNKNGWIRLELEGTRSNRNGFGARVEARVGGKMRRAQLTSGRSYLSQCEQVITLGLGTNKEAVDVNVYWPGDETVQKLGNLPAGSYIKVRQPEAGQ